MRGVKRYVRYSAIEIVMKQGVGFSKPASDEFAVMQSIFQTRFSPISGRVSTKVAQYSKY